MIEGTSIIGSVAAGGTILGGSTVNNNAAGGILTIASQPTLGPAFGLQVEDASYSNYGSVAVLGPVDLNGATLLQPVDGAFEPRQRLHDPHQYRGADRDLRGGSERHDHPGQQRHRLRHQLPQQLGDPDRRRASPHVIHRERHAIDCSLRIELDACRNGPARRSERNGDLCLRRFHVVRSHAPHDQLRDIGRSLCGDVPDHCHLLRWRPQRRVNGDNIVDRLATPDELHRSSDTVEHLVRKHIVALRERTPRRCNRNGHLYIRRFDAVYARCSRHQLRHILDTCGAGTYPVVATYSGDTDNAGSTASTSLTVMAAATTFTASATPSSVSFGTSSALAAAGLPGDATGSVTFASGGQTLCTALLPVDDMSNCNDPCRGDIPDLCHVLGRCELIRLHRHHIAHRHRW